MIDTYGWSDALQDAFAPHAAQALIAGRITVQHRGLYGLVTDLGDLTGQISGRLARDADAGGYPAVGDWVAVSARSGEEAATIHAVLPRRTAFVRRAADSVATQQVVAANVDVALLVASMNADLNPRRLERYLASAWQSGASPVVVLTKADLASPSAAGEYIAAVAAVAFGAQVLPVSAVTGEGMAALAARLAPRRTSVLVGSSGVGKSSLVNALAGEPLMATARVRENDARGRHTTTHRELIRLPGGHLILDTPGMRELGLLGADEGLSATFEDIEALAADCRFSDCGHAGEPGCAVRGALEIGALDPGRWKSFVKLQRELDYQRLKDSPEAKQARLREWRPILKAQRARRKARRLD